MGIKWGKREEIVKTRKDVRRNNNIEKYKK